MSNKKPINSGEYSLRVILGVIVGIILLNFISGLIPDQSWFYDTTPVCNEGYESAIAEDGSYLVCVKKGYYDTTNK